jgi:hypothetical protein
MFMSNPAIACTHVFESSTRNGCSSQVCLDVLSEVYTCCIFRTPNPGDMFGYGDGRREGGKGARKGKGEGSFVAEQCPTVYRSYKVAQLNSVGKLT